MQGVLTVVIHRARRRRRRLLALLLIAAAIVAAFLWRNREQPTSVPALQPFDGILTDQSICAVTLSLTGVESDAALELFRSVCIGMEVRPCVFVTIDWLEKHRDKIHDLSYAELGLLFERAPGGANRKRVMANLAEENERFLALTGSFPRFVRFSSGAPNATVSAALQAYGQILVSSRSSLVDVPSPGAIADCGLLNGTTGYTLAKYCAAAFAEGYTLLPLSDLQKYI